MYNPGKREGNMRERLRKSLMIFSGGGIVFGVAGGLALNNPSGDALAGDHLRPPTPTTISDFKPVSNPNIVIEERYIPQPEKVPLPPSTVLE